MKLRPGFEWPLGLFALLAGAPVLAAIAYLFWTDEIALLQSGGPLLRNIPVGHAALIIFIAIMAVVSLILAKRRPAQQASDEEASTRYSDRD